jgi:plastocyanin
MRRAVGRKSMLKIAGCALSMMLSASVLAQGVDVTAHVSIESKTGAAHRRLPSSADVVVWLTPLQPDANAATMGHPGPFRLVQKDKMFMPHLLVVPAGSSVEFPNEDPFFHNVFSLFNGKRFDLGLYESGTSRAVRFDREGVSYIFCNIHPEMGAVVVALRTPYWGISTTSGGVTIHNVPPGNYRMHVWSESARATMTDRTVQIGATPAHLGEITLEGAADPLAHHKNKFGEDYRSDRTPAY